MRYSGGSMFSNMTDVVKNLVIINVLFFLATFVLESFNLNRVLGLFYFDSPNFEPWQILTHMFMHGGFMHIFFNMYALVIFGSKLEMLWGAERFLKFYLICGLGAVFLHMGVQAIEVLMYTGTFKASLLDGIPLEGASRVQQIYSVPTVGASGAIYGVLIGMFVLFPNTEIMIFPLPIQIKLGYLIPVLIISELYLGVNNFAWDNVAHFAHLGGALFGYILIRMWGNDRNKFY